MKKVMVFGVFDGVHEGHRAFFREAKTHGEHLIAVVAQDEVVQRLKGRLPSINLANRFAELEAEDGVDEVVIGDSKLGTYGVVKKYRPDVIALGYDQDALENDLEIHRKDFDWGPKIVKMTAYEPNKYHNSLLKR